MKRFDAGYILFDSMCQDGYFPDLLVDKVKGLVENVIRFLETVDRNTKEIQNKFDEMTLAINELQGEFEENGDELETVARESIAETVGYILEWFNLDIDIEDAIGERDW